MNQLELSDPPVSTDIKTVKHEISKSSPEQVLAHAIAQTKLTDEQLARMTAGRLSPGEIANYRRGLVSPLPNWLNLTSLLNACDLAPEQIRPSRS